MVPQSLNEYVRRTFTAHVSERGRHGTRVATLAALERSDVAQAFTIAEVLDKTYRKRLHPQERQRLERIETLRDRCVQADEQLEYVDFGAGDPRNPTSQDDAREGVRRTIQLSRLALHTSKTPPWSDLLYNLVRALRPRRCLELGTCLGFSAAYQCAAMTLNGTGVLTTLEGDPGFAARAESHLRSLGLSRHRIVVGPFERTLDGVLAECGPFEFMFNDGHHDGAAMLRYFEQSLPAFEPDAVLLFDDINNYESMKSAWRTLTQHERVALAVDFGPMGLVCLGQRRAPVSVYSFPL